MALTTHEICVTEIVNISVPAVVDTENLSSDY